MTKKKLTGLLILLAVIAISFGYVFFSSNKPQEVSIDGLIGGEKIGLVQDEAFKKQVKKSHGLSLDYHKDGSFAMVQGQTEGYDYLWPSSQIALELFEKLGKKHISQDIVFNTPIVLYSRKAVVEALEKEKIVQNEDGVYFVDMSLLAELVAEGKSWKDIGLTALYGDILVDTTDPNESNSGNMFLGLLANSLNGGKVVKKADVEKIVPQIKTIYQKIGHMQTSSSDMFNQYLKQGIGAYPIIAGYENQLLEFSKEDPETFAALKDDLVILYPSPTVWSSHVYIALTDQGKVALEALKTKEVQTLAWKNHGFRTITAGTADPKEFDVQGVPKDIIKVMPMPDVDVMLELMQIIRED